MCSFCALTKSFFAHFLVLVSYHYCYYTLLLSYFLLSGFAFAECLSPLPHYSTHKGEFVITFIENDQCYYYCHHLCSYLSSSLFLFILRINSNVRWKKLHCPHFVYGVLCSYKCWYLKSTLAHCENGPSYMVKMLKFCFFVSLGFRRLIIMNIIVHMTIDILKCFYNKRIEAGKPIKCTIREVRKMLKCPKWMSDFPFQLEVHGMKEDLWF